MPALISQGVPFNLLLKHVLLDAFQNCPFVELEVAVFLIEVLLLGLIDGDESVEHPSSVLLVLSLLLNEVNILVLAYYVHLKEVWLF